MRIFKVVCLAGILALGQGCYYGSMIGARTLGEDHMTITGAVSLPAYLNADDRREAGEDDLDNVPVSPSLTFLSGATDRIDIGVSGRAYGIGPMVRVGVFEPADKAALSLIAGANYIIPAKLLATQFGISAGYHFGSSLEVYTGWDGGYGPDVINIPEDTDGKNDWDEVENTFHYSVIAGVMYDLPTGEAEWIPESICFEFTLPMDLTRDLVMFGLAVAY
ncbi:MAG: hypothetical protein KAH54_06170 [Candidatus Sabulitectum sp.]|nr:hypothetical protein [Candidatus Sabulitectum sp.]